MSMTRTSGSVCSHRSRRTAASTPAPAQQQQRQPNILVIMGDDVGWFNIGAYHRGIMSGKTPNLDKLAVAGHAVHRLLRRGELHGGPGELHHRRDSAAHGPDDRGPGRRRRRHPGQGLHARHRAQGAGLRHRPVRQEPPRRPEQVPADGARLRRVLRLPVPPRRDVGPVLVLVPDRRGLLQQVRPAQPGALLGDRHGRPDRDAALGQGRQAEDRG